MSKPLSYFCSGPAIELLRSGYGEHLEELNEAQKLDLLLLVCEARLNEILIGSLETSEVAYPAFTLVQEECHSTPGFAAAMIEAIACQIAHPPTQADSITVEVAGMAIEVEPTEPLTSPSSED